MNFIIINCLISFIIIIFFIFFSRYFNLYDVPNSRKIHNIKVPVTGGLSIFFIILFSTFFFTYDHLFILSLFISSLLIIIGFIDDVFYIKFYFRLMVQFIAIILAIYNGIYIKELIIFNFISNSNLLEFVLISFTFLCLLTLLNSINFIDGIDGLSSSLIILLILFIILNAYILNINVNLIPFGIIIVSLSIFLLFNLSLFNLPKIFLGDAGSCFIGFFIGCLLIIYSGEPYNLIDKSLIPWLLAIPIYDFLSVSMIRILNKKSPFYPDNNHIHHLLLNKKLNQTNVLIIILIIQSILSVYGMFVSNFTSMYFSILNYVILFLVYFFLINILKKNYI